MPLLDITFSTPENPEQTHPGKLFLDEAGRHWLEFNAQGYENDIMHFPVVYVVAELTGVSYTLIHCSLSQMELLTIRLSIQELIIGEHSPAVTVPYYKGIEAEINMLEEWINHRPFNYNFSAQEASVSTLPSFEKTYAINDSTTLELQTWCYHKFQKQEAVFATRSRIKIETKEPASRMMLNNYLLSFLRLQSLFCSKMPGIQKLILCTQENDSHEIQMPSIKKRPGSANDVLITLDQLQSYFPDMVSRYYNEACKYSKIFDLLNESSMNKTAEISYLNITTALEVFHKIFLVERSENLMMPYMDLMIQEKVVTKREKKWINATRYYHLLETVKDIAFFQQRVPDSILMVRKMRNSRNWYTHYDDLGGEIWTPAKLIHINHLLRGLIKAVILIELNLPCIVINKILNADAYLFFHDHEKNPYSLSYIDVKANEE